MSQGRGIRRIHGHYGFLRPLHARLHRCAIGHWHSVWIHMLTGKSGGILYATQELANALGVANRTVFVAHQQGPKVANLFVELSNLIVEAVVLCRIHFHFGLKVGEPLLLSLSTFECGHTVVLVSV